MAVQMLLLLLSTLFWSIQTALVLVLLGLALGLGAMYLNPSRRRNRLIARSFAQPANALPLIGHLLQIIKPQDEINHMVRDLREKLGSRFVISIFGKPVFFISDPQAVEAVLSSSKLTTKGRMYNFLHPWLGQGLLTSQGKLWHSRRKLLTPAFHFRILDGFADHLEHQAECLVDELEVAMRTAAEDETPLDVVPIISAATLRAICVTAMGKVGFKTDPNSPGGSHSEKSYFDAIHRIGMATVQRIVRPWLWLPPLFKLTAMYKTFSKDLKTLHKYTEKVIAERKKILLDNTENPTAESEGDGGARKKSRLRPFLDVLINAQRAGADLSDRDIRHEVDTFMFEGHDTTSMALSWAMELIGSNPEVQDRLAKELRSAGSDWESVSKLPYLDRVYKECLRLRPSVPLIARLLQEDAVLPNGQILPANAECVILIYHLHHHPDQFPDPERFDPDRFSPENEQSRHPFAYVPFSAGPRNCIGKRFAVMEVKLLLAAVVRRFRIRSAMQDNKDFIADLVLRPRTGVFVELERRGS